jgi:outer membrane receptor protein involved in Fe transport
VLESLGTSDNRLEEGTSWIYQVSADGPIVDLWAGELQAAVGAEYRAELVDFPLQAADDLFGARAVNRYATGVFAELRLPLLSERQGIPLVNRFEVMVAARRDVYARDEFDDAAKPRYGLMYRPVSWLMARASYGEGYKVPTLAQLYQPPRTTTINFNVNNPGLDIYRNNEPLPLQLPITIGGNPNLAPEETESTTAGLVLEIPGQLFRGLSFSYDYYDHKYFNRIGFISLIDRMVLFPELFERGPNLPGDPAGWPGPITGYDNRSVNVALSRISGWDVGVKYMRPTPWGEILFTGNASRAYRNENRTQPGAPPATNAVPQALPLKASGGLFWSRSALEIGALVSYRDVFKRSVTERPTPSAIRWDWRTSYDFADSSLALADRSGWWGGWLADTRMSLTIFNIFDKPPPMSGAGLPESSLLDAVGRRYSLSFSTSFGN